MVTVRPKLIYDKEKCGNAALCLRCAKACPMRCIAYLNTKTPEPRSPSPPDDWRLITCFMVNCNACGACVEACPNDALRLEVPELPTPTI